ncbi:MAG: hemin uptake protein HemP [Planctomycetaceae bacterium]
MNATQSDSQTSTSSGETHACGGERPDSPKQITSNDLLGGAHEILIRHGDELYRLRVTRNGKLILHK